jgi:SP family arabinose:H+ symporter-like MFS transporter
MTYNFRYLLSISFATALGGLLFGFDISVISGTIPFLQKYFSLTEAAKGWLVSSALLGCIVGATVSGRLGDRFGRRIILQICAVFFAVSAVGSGFAETVTGFMLYRIMGGLAVGGASVLAPMYIAEVSPAEIRGRMVSINQLAIVFGISLAYYSNYYLLKLGDESWRYMLASGAIPSLVFLISICFVPESPRWLVKRNHPQKAAHILSKIGNEKYAQKELAAIEGSLSEEVRQGTVKDMIKPEMRFVLLLGIFLAIFQQWCGINVIFFYAPDIFAKSNIGLDSALFQTTLIGLTNLLFTIVAMWAIDKIGRKSLMMIGSVGMAVSYLVVGYLMKTGHTTGWMMMVFILLTIALYAISLGPVVWVVIAEIFPNRLRGTGMAVATFFLWVSCYTLTLSFPMIMSAIGGNGAFITYSLICIAGAVITYIFLPETKGKSLENIEKELIGKKQEIFEEKTC